ncbi:hypothetical protein N0V87_010421, partial [Didymella glomerata]
KTIPRMEDSQSKNSSDDHRTFQNNELNFISHDFAPPSIRELWDAVRTTGKDGYVRRDDPSDEELELSIMEKLDAVAADLVAMPMTPTSMSLVADAENDVNN